MQVLWEEALGVPSPGVRLQMTCRLKGGGGEIRNAEAARLQNGLEELVAVEGEPFGSSYASLLWGR